MEIPPGVPAAFAALGNATRLAVVEQLLREGERAAGDLARPGISAPAMSHHFRVLREAGIVRQRVDAQRRLYSVEPAAIRAVGQWSLSWREFWDQSFDRLAAAIAAEPEPEPERDSPRGKRRRKKRKHHKGKH